MATSSSGGNKPGGNFANDPEKAREAGRKGGEHSHSSGSSSDSSTDESKGGGNFATDRKKASEAGRKGGEHSHGGSKG